MTQYLGDGKHVFFDVDDTLIMWTYPADQEENAIDLPALNGETVRVLPHLKHLEMVKRHKQIGNIVIVWSKSGAPWAQHIVNCFGLNDHVDLACGKPVCFYDDLPPEKFMTERRYMKDHYQQ